MSSSICLHLEDGEKVSLGGVMVSKSDRGNDVLCFDLCVGGNRVTVFFNSLPELLDFCSRHNIAYEGSLNV